MQIDIDKLYKVVLACQKMGIQVSAGNKKYITYDFIEMISTINCMKLFTNIKKV